MAIILMNKEELLASPQSLPVEEPIMHRHRFRNSLENTSPLAGPSTTLVSASGFMVCPLTIQQGMMGPAFLWQQLYRLAFEQAQAGLCHERWERQRTVLWN
jgi:hypothetical protein